MNQQSLFRLLLRPSFLSGAAVVLIAFGILGYTGWLYLHDNNLFFNTLLGENGLQSYLARNAEDIGTTQKVLLASPAAYYVLVGGVAVAAGVVVFTLLQIIGSLFRSTSYFVHEAIGGGKGRIAFWGEQFVRMCLRVLALVGGTIYASAFVSMILPFAVLLNQTGIEGVHQNNLTGLLLCGAALLLLVAAMHVLIVLLRLIILRPRLFGGDEDIAAAEALH